MALQHFDIINTQRST